jgi:hypothetical protein
VIAALPALAAALASVSVTATSGPVTATLSGVGAASDNALTAASGVRLTIARRGAVAYHRPLRPCRFGCEPNDPSGARHAALRVADLDGDREPEVLVDRSDGFTPCCSLETAIMRRDRSTGAYTELDRRWGAGYRIADLDGDRRLELVTSDLRFYQRFAPRLVGFQLPVQVVALRGGRIVDVTRAHLGPVRRHARSLARLLRRTDALADGPRGRSRTFARAALRPQLAAYAAEQRLLGHRRAGDRRVAHEARRGRVSRSFRHRLMRFLSAMGYR